MRLHYNWPFLCSCYFWLTVLLKGLYLNHCIDVCCVWWFLLSHRPSVGVCVCVCVFDGSHYYIIHLYLCWMDLTISSCMSMCVFDGLLVVHLHLYVYFGGSCYSIRKGCINVKKSSLRFSSILSEVYVTAWSQNHIHCTSTSTCM